MKEKRNIQNRIIDKIKANRTWHIEFDRMIKHMLIRRKMNILNEKLLRLS